MPIMAQKSLLGHSKGGSAAWQMVGLIQTVTTGIVPGNRNSDNIDSHFKDRRFLIFPSKSIHTDGIRAGVMVRASCLKSTTTRSDAPPVLVQIRPSRRHSRHRQPPIPLCHP
ncbi:hypothetical protein DFH07DRAFT_553456 [Mycena maculata]|uniref:Beta-ketoacyl synthase C-terminal domain-containing protein n=1 Tax=Mycena maculata TaxID=230809 RepID=A0AAD7IU95_9AGAR|nr:hypothetical protein DFH07DRAFT_553456 [Mycena maculata]